MTYAEAEYIAVAILCLAGAFLMGAHYIDKYNKNK